MTVYNVIEPVLVSNINLENITNIHTDNISKSLFITMSDGTVKFLGDMFHHQASGMLLNPNLHSYNYEFDYIDPGDGGGAVPASSPTLFYYNEYDENEINPKTNWFLPQPNKIVTNPYILKENVRKKITLQTLYSHDNIYSISIPAILTKDNNLYIGGNYTYILATNMDFFPYQEYPFLKNKILDICQVIYQESYYTYIEEYFILTTDNKLYKVDQNMNQLVELYTFDKKITNIYNGYREPIFYIKDEDNIFYIFDIYKLFDQEHVIDINNNMFSDTCLNTPNLTNATSLENIFLLTEYNENVFYYGVVKDKQIFLWNIYEDNIITHTFSTKIKKISTTPFIANTQFLLTNGEVYTISDTNEMKDITYPDNDNWVELNFYVNAGTPNPTYMSSTQVAVINNIYLTETSEDFNNLLDDYTCQVWASSNYPVSDGFTYYSESRDVIDPQYIWRSDENSQQSISIFIPNFQSLGNVRYLKLVIDLPDDFWLHPQTLGYFEIYTATDSFDFPYYNIFDYANQEGFNCKFIYEYDIWEDISRIYPIVGNGDYTELYD